MYFLNITKNKFLCQIFRISNLFRLIICIFKLKSQNRANNVLAYCYQIENDFINSNREWLEKLMRANGMAFSKLIYKENTNHEQDFERSRRVEFRVLTKEHKNDD